MKAACARRGCRQPTGHPSGYCSDTCVAADHDLDQPPVNLWWSHEARLWVYPTPVVLPRIEPSGIRDPRTVPPATP